MDKKNLIIAASAVTIVVLGRKLYVTNRHLQRLSKSSTKLVGWTDIAQDVIKDVWTKHPELVGELPDDVNEKIAFYNIMVKEDLI